jgi:hypothetical protein
MGLYRTDYIVYGWKVKITKDFDPWDDKYLSMIEGHINEEFTLTDTEGINGINNDDHCIFGLRLFIEDEWDITELDFSKGFDNNKINTKYEEVFGMKSTEEPKVLIFSKWN